MQAMCVYNSCQLPPFQPSACLQAPLPQLKPCFHSSYHSFEGHSCSSQPTDCTALFIDTRASFPSSLLTLCFGYLGLARLISTEHSAPSHLQSQLWHLPASQRPFPPVRASSGLRVKAPAAVRLAPPREQHMTASCIRVGSR